MNVQVTMPQLGETVTEGTVTRWLRGVGEHIGDQEPLLEISTDKVDTEVPAPAAGRLIEILVPEDATVTVGTALALIGPDEPVAAAPPAAAPANGHRPRHRHSPRVRRLAAEAGLDPSTLVGSGPSGRVTPADVAAAVAAPAPPTDPVRNGAPATTQLSTVVEVDLTGLLAVLARSGAHVTVTACLARAALDALHAFPMLAASSGARGRIVTHLGVELDTPRGVVTAVLRNAGDLNVAGLARQIAEAVERARDRSVSGEEPSGATFTIADTGNRGMLLDAPVLAPGQAGVVGLGAAVERPVVIASQGGERVIAIRSVAYLSLTRDAARVDGAAAAGFLTFVKRRLESGPFDDESAE